MNEKRHPLLWAILGVTLIWTASTVCADHHIVNGLNTTVLSSLIDTLKEHPEGGRVTFVTNTKWQDGMRSFTSLSSYKIDGKMYHEAERQFVLLGDEGMELSGTDAAPGAIEELMYAVGTCVTAAANANAALMGVKLSQLDVALESDLDLHGLFALDENVRPGIQELRAKIQIAGDADDETLQKIAMLGYKYSPVSDSVRNGVSAKPEVMATQQMASGESSDSMMVNGLDTKALGGLMGMLKEHPEGGRVTFMSDTKWQDGMRSLTSFAGYKIDGKMHHEMDRQFVLLGDEGMELSGTDAAPGAVEELMYAAGTCIVAAANANAALMGVKLNQLEVALESDLDLHGLFALDENVRPGIQELRAKIQIAGDADEETLRKIAMLGYNYSPVSDSVRNGVSAKPEVWSLNNGFYLIPVPDLKATNSFSRISDSGDLLRISSRLIQIWYKVSKTGIL